MAEQDNIEVYRQRYETFRHLDKLRWQMLQILVAIGSLTVLLIKVSEKAIGAELYLLIGLTLLLVSYIMHRINHGIRINGRVLAEAGKLVGDGKIPTHSKGWKSSSNWICFFVFFAGLSSILFAANLHFNFICGA